MIRSLKVIVFTLFSVSTLAQTEEICGTDSINDLKEVEFNIIAEETFSAEDTVYESGFTRSKKIIPVIVHLFEEENGFPWFDYYTEEQVTRTIKELNLHLEGGDYAWFNGGGSGSFSNIKFCIADKSPTGELIEGIRYYQWDTLNAASTADLQGSPFDYYQDVFNECAYKPLNYCNIWIIPWDYHIKGFSFYPPKTWGVWMKTSAFGQVYGYYDSHVRVLEHEIGHYLGLKHTFHNWASTSCLQAVDNEIDCRLQGDKVCDTPPTPINWECAQPACETADLKNYMDYTNDGCVERFTLGQIHRMHDKTESGRPHLILDGSVCSECPTNQICPYDLDNNGEIGATDLLDVLVQYGNPVICSDYDFDLDGQIGAQDILSILSQYGNQCEGIEPWSPLNSNIVLDDIDGVMQVEYLDLTGNNASKRPKVGLQIVEYHFITGLILRKKISIEQRR